MKPLQIESTPSTPEIDFNPESGVFQILGRSLPESVFKFYDPIMDWIDEYIEAPAEKTIFHFRMKYFNTASSKMFLRLLVKVRELVENDKNILIKWYYEEDDEDMIEAGEEYEDASELDFEFIEEEEE